MRRGWKSTMVITLPRGWELREEEDYLILYDPMGQSTFFGLHTSPEFLENFIERENLKTEG